jgi:hypothetical protein
VDGELVGERRPRDAERLGGARLIAGAALQRVDDALAFVAVAGRGRRGRRGRGVAATAAGGSSVARFEITGILRAGGVASSTKRATLISIGRSRSS